MRIENTIYLDYQSSTPIDPRVLRTLTSAMSSLVGNPHSSEHAIGWLANDRLEASVAGVADSIGADPDEVIFTSGATEANNTAILGIARRSFGSDRNRILVSSIEHKCVLEAANSARDQYNVLIETMPVNNNGELDLILLNQMLDETVLLVCIIGVHNEFGTVQQIPDISRLCERVGAIVHVDGTHMPAVGPIDVNALGVGSLSLSGHKIYGPKGIGALYLRRDLQARFASLIVGGELQRGLRAGTAPLPLCLAFADALKLMSASSAGICALRNELWRLLQEGLGNRVILNGPSLPNRHPGNLNVRIEGVDARDLILRLQPRLAVSNGSACNSGIVGPSYSLQAIGLSVEQATESIRFGVGRFTDIVQIREAAGLLIEHVARLT